MKKNYGSVLKYLLILLIGILPLITWAQEGEEEDMKKGRSTSFTPHWYANINAGIQLSHADVAKNPWIPPTSSWRFAFGGRLGWQFLSFLGVRGEVTYGRLADENPDLWGSSIYYKGWATGWHFQPTINFSHLFGGYRDRTVNIYGLLGVGGFSYETQLWEKLDAGDRKVMQVKDAFGNNIFVAADSKSESDMGELKHVWSWPLGLGISFRLHERWDLNLETQWRWLDTESLDRVNKPRDYPVRNDMTSYTSLGLTYKFAFREGLKNMEKDYDKVVFSAVPDPLEVHGDSIKVTVKGTIPPKYFDKKSAMLVRPFLEYGDQSYAVETKTLKGEDVPGDGIVMNYKEGGSFEYTTYIPYDPAMNTSELVVIPLIYGAKEGTYPTEAEIVENAKHIYLGKRKLVDGVIYTSKRIMNDEIVMLAPHGYELETIITKKAKIFFFINRYDLNWRVPLNKEEESKNKLQAVSDFIALGWDIKDIDIKGWASPEGEETFNRDLSENRANTSYNYLIREIRKMSRAKDSKLKIKDPAEEVQFDISWHGPDWEGFMVSVQKSDLKDKSAIINVIESSGQAKREEEIRNMIAIYPEIEENLLPPLRRAEIYVNSYEPKRTMENIRELGLASPDSLEVDELLYSATLYDDNESKYKIYYAATQLFPENWIAFNNAGAIALEKGEHKVASMHLSKANSLAPNNGKVLNNLGVYEAHMGNYEKAEQYFRNAQSLGEDASYNIGVMEILDGKYSNALRLFGSRTCNYNVALAQLETGDNAGAEKNLQCAPENAQTYYLLAVVGARTNNTTLMYESLMKAVEMDPELKNEAKRDLEFKEFFNAPDFQSIVQ